MRAVRQASSSSAGAGKEDNVEIKVYRVETGTSRVEYFVLGLDREGGRIVGLRARAVES